MTKATKKQRARKIDGLKVTSGLAFATDDLRSLEDQIAPQFRSMIRHHRNLVEAAHSEVLSMVKRVRK